MPARPITMRPLSRALERAMLAALTCAPAMIAGCGAMTADQRPAPVAHEPPDPPATRPTTVDAERMASAFVTAMIAGDAAACVELAAFPFQWGDRCRWLVDASALEHVVATQRPPPSARCVIEATERLSLKPADARPAADIARMLAANQDGCPDRVVQLVAEAQRGEQRMVRVAVRGEGVVFELVVRVERLGARTAVTGVGF